MKTRILLSFLLAFCFVGVGFAQSNTESEAGTTGSMHLLVPVTARTVGMGNTLASGLKGANAIEQIFSNPAGLAANTGTTALFSRMNYVADIGVNHVGVAQSFGTSSAALTFTNWNFGDIPLQTELSPDPNSVTYTAGYTTLGLSFARQVTDRIAAGVTAKVVNERIDDMSQTTVAFDGGMTYIVGESGLRFGVSLQNFGPKSAFTGTGLNRYSRNPSAPGNAAQTNYLLEAEAFPLPSTLSFGAAYTKSLAGDINATLAGSFKSTGLGPDAFGGGVELGFKNLFFVRGGYQLYSAQDASMYTGLNAGAGLNLNLSGLELSIDYAYRQVEYFSAPQLLTVGVKF